MNIFDLDIQTVFEFQFIIFNWVIHNDWNKGNIVRNKINLFVVRNKTRNLDNLRFIIKV